MTEYIKNPLSGKLRGVTYEDGKIIDVHIRDTDDVVKVFVPVRYGQWLSWEEQFPGEKPRRINNLGVFCDRCHKHSDNRTDFCPNCGACMGKEESKCDT